MQKNKIKQKLPPLKGGKINQEEDISEMMKMQDKISRLQESLDCLFGYLVSKKIIQADEFKLFLAHKYSPQLAQEPVINPDLSGTVAITYYNNETAESVP